MKNPSPDILSLSRRTPKQWRTSALHPQAYSNFGIGSAGRYSMMSAVGLSTMISIGPENFHAMLSGFHQIDEHFRDTAFDRNVPVLMGLLSVWYTNFFDAPAIAVLPYDPRFSLRVLLRKRWESWWLFVSIPSSLKVLSGTSTRSTSGESNSAKLWQSGFLP